MVTVRSTMNPLWFDREKHPEKQELFENMLQEEMETIRAGKKSFERTFLLEQNVFLPNGRMENLINIRSNRTLRFIWRDP